MAISSSSNKYRSSLIHVIKRLYNKNIVEHRYIRCKNNLEINESHGQNYSVIKDIKYCIHQKLKLFFE
jgi:hypothetical protein